MAERLDASATAMATAATKQIQNAMRLIGRRWKVPPQRKLNPRSEGKLAFRAMPTTTPIHRTIHHLAPIATFHLFRVFEQITDNSQGPATE